MSTADWAELDRRHLWHPYTQMQTAPPPIPVVAGEGAYLITADGRRLLDGISSWWVNIHGHAHPRLGRALAEQAARLPHVIFAGFTHEPAARLAAELVKRTPGNLPRVFFSDDGSTAVEAAMKMAFQSWRQRGATRRNLFVALDEAYHGDTFGAMATGGTSNFHGIFDDLLFEVRRIATPESRRQGSQSPELDEVLSREGDRVVAVLVEPMIQGAAGMLVQPPEFLRAIAARCRSRGIPWIADEVFTGFGRTGAMFACEHAGVAPDLLCLSKALTGGYLPLAATLASEEIYAAFLSDDRSRTFFHGHSYTGNALACAVALESLALFDDEDRLGRIAELETLFRQRMEGLAKLPSVREPRVLGPMAALRISPTAGSGLASEPAGYYHPLGPQVQKAFLERGLFLRPLGDVLYFLPPYIVTDEEVHRVFDLMEEILGGL
ncbi:MAG: adenosylmethionine--8-amino-7-oxononanoate transaminase [Holophagales bacterium]|nr:adenosylmethionine--8-amino-7-oxononanoate transaminase [Holophagales bacterium]